jgi:mannose-6-phosphate isomerase
MKAIVRPWGQYKVLEKGATYKIKEIVVKPGKRLSLQKHQHRSEHWVVVSGTAYVECGEDKRTLNINESTYVPIGCHHRLENPGKIPLVIVEVQNGEYLEEDDIVRYDDDFGRKKKKT